MSARTRVWLRLAALLVAEAILVGVSGVPAYAQFPDVLSDVECPACGAQLAPLPFEGTWSTPLTAAGEAGWALADFACVTACTAQARSRAVALLAARGSTVELLPALAALGFRKLTFGCDALGFADQSVSPLPLQIRREGGALVLRYEERGGARRIELAGTAPLGSSVGHFERDALVVETRTAGVTATERYSVSADRRWLDLTLTLAPAGKNERTVTVTKRWLRTPGVQLAVHGCDAMSAGLEASLADYVDPSKLDARR